MPSDGLQQLPCFASKTSSAPVQPDLSVFCSPHDLIAIVTADNDVVIYRLNGQIAFSIKCKDPDDLTVTAAKWKPDGSLLAVGWSDGSWGVHDGGTGKLVGEGRISGGAGGSEWKMDLEPGWGVDDDGENVTKVAGFGWERHDVTALKADKSNLGGGGEVDTEGWADGLKDPEEDEEDNQASSQLTDLPRSITTLDTSKILPRLSAIPAHGLRSGPEGARFATQATTDGVFDVKKADAFEFVDVLVVYTDCGDVRVLLDDTVPIGSFKLEVSPLKHTSHPTAGSHVLLSRSQDGNFQFHNQDLPLASLSGPLLHVIARDTKRIQSTLGYLTQIIRCISHDYTTELQFPTRLMNNINMTLSESEQPQGDLAYNLCHLAMTGQLTPIMLEWLTDIVKEPNHKRWDTAISSMYSRIQSHIFVNLIPVLDRMSIAVCSLRGQAEMHRDTTVFDVEPGLFSNILEGINSLRLVAQKVQLICIHEWQQFRAFSKWLRVQIEMGTTGPFSKSALETEEKEAMSIDYLLVLGYIKETMGQSNLTPYVQKLPELRGVLEREDFFKHPIMQSMSYDGTKEALKASGELKGRSCAQLNFQAITVSLAGHIQVALERITEWQSKMVPSFNDHAGPSALPSDASVCDMRMLADERKDLAVSVLISHENKLHVHVVHSKFGPSTFSGAESIPSKLLDAKLLSEKCCILLRQSDEEAPTVLSVALLGRDSVTAEATVHTFDPEDAFQPQKLLVGGRRGKEVCVVFGDNGKAWRVLDISQKQVDSVLEAEGLVDGGRDGMIF